MHQKNAKREFAARLITSATVIRSPRNNDPSEGYEYEIMFHDKDGDMYRKLTKQRGGIRTFSNLSAAENVLIDIGFRMYTVLMLEYQHEMKGTKRLSEFGPEDVYVPS